jgi:hypothetical protein
MSVNATVANGDAPGAAATAPLAPEDAPDAAAPGDAADAPALGEGLPSAASEGLLDGLMTATGVADAEASDAALGGDVTSAVVVSVFFAHPAVTTAAQRTKAGM